MTKYIVHNLSGNCLLREENPEETWAYSNKNEKPFTVGLTFKIYEEMEKEHNFPSFEAESDEEAIQIFELLY